jgi:hypothetical protein
METAMNNTHKSKDIEIGYHPDGYRIDKTTSPINRYTKWDIASNGRWINLKPVCFDSLPEDGWIMVDHFDWNDSKNK